MLNSGSRKVNWAATEPLIAPSLTQHKYRRYSSLFPWKCYLCRNSSCPTDKDMKARELKKNAFCALVWTRKMVLKCIQKRTIKHDERCPGDIPLHCRQAKEFPESPAHHKDHQMDRALCEHSICISRTRTEKSEVQLCHHEKISTVGPRKQLDSQNHPSPRRSQIRSYPWMLTVLLKPVSRRVHGANELLFLQSGQQPFGAGCKEQKHEMAWVAMDIKDH